MYIHVHVTLSCCYCVHNNTIIAGNIGGELNLADLQVNCQIEFHGWIMNTMVLQQNRQIKICQYQIFFVSAKYKFHQYFQQIILKGS